MINIELLFVIKGMTQYMIPAPSSNVRSGGATSRGGYYTGSYAAQYQQQQPYRDSRDGNWKR